MLVRGGVFVVFVGAVGEVLGCVRFVGVGGGGKHVRCRGGPTRVRLFGKISKICQSITDKI